jgi:hypothetical protein
MAKKETKQRVIAFRINTDKGTALDAWHTEHKIINIHSSNTLARKILLDFIDGRLTYKNHEDALIDPSLKV